MPEPMPVRSPAGYVTPQAICFTDANGAAVFASAARPMPAAVTLPPAIGTALSGSASGQTVAGPFAPELGRAIWLTLDGSWAGRVTVERSVDGGATKRPLTVSGQAWASFTGNAQEPVVEETVADATYYLAIALTSGTVAFEVRQ